MNAPFLPFTSLSGDQRELGLVVAVLLGFAFGFVLERAGFGRADKLAAQFYLRDLTVFKVMFSAIVTAMLGVVLASGLGLVDLKLLSEGAASTTYVWSMMIGGVLLGVGFIISGYCPGTSAVSAASGNLDGVLTFVGVILGSMVYAEAYPVLGKLYGLGDQGQLFLYDVLKVPAPVLAIAVTLMALGMFVGGEKLEKLMARRRGAEAPVSVAERRPRRLAFSVLGATGLVTLATLALPTSPRAATAPAQVASISQERLARRVLDEPWTLRVLDVRSRKACEASRIPGAECTPLATVGELGLPYAAGERDLVLVTSKTPNVDGGAGGGVDTGWVPVSARSYRGKVFVLEGGFSGWRAYALTRPKPPAATAGAAEREAYMFRSALNSAMTGRKPPPPPAAGAVKYTPAPRKKKGGGCG